jgi:transposase-like protein
MGDNAKGEIMNALQLQRRPLYSIGTVSRLTGVKPDTLRVWERRYQLGASKKSASGRRMFTQADLEHLQLVAALVSAGTRIGDIARSERRTLEVLLRSRGSTPGKEIPQRKQRVLFIGDALCSWLDQHQGCLSGIDALLLSAPLEEASGDLLDGLGEGDGQADGHIDGSLDGIVVEVAGLGEVTTQQVTALAKVLGVDNVLVLHRYSSGRWLAELEQRGYSAAEFPPDPAFLASHLSVSAAVKEAGQGLESLGDLVQGKPRLFEEKALSEARKLKKVLDCECPQHIVDLVRALADFEEYSTNCSAENWQDASLHACVYAYAGQARWLMEKALLLVTEGHEQPDENAGSPKPLEAETA